MDYSQAEIHRMAHSKDEGVRRDAVHEFFYNFAIFHDKEQAWSDLIRMAQDESDYVRWGAADSLGKAFPYLPTEYREQAWRNLQSLIENDDRFVRISINHALGRASILKATETENEEIFRKELENALNYFENSSRESLLYNPANFCICFYLAFHTITFMEQGREEKVKKYLVGAKYSMIESSESKERLLEVVENLENALEETRTVMEIDELRVRKWYRLNSYRRYFDRAAYLLDTTEEKAPVTTKLIRKGLPIIDNKIRAILWKDEEET